MTRDDAATLIQIARTDRDAGVRRIAIEKIDAPEVLSELGAAETERGLRELIHKRASELWMSQACGSDADDASSALGGIIKVGDPGALVEVAARASLPAIRKRAFGELRDARALAQLARSDAPQDLRIAAVAQIDDGDVLRGLAVDTTQKEVGLAAVEKIDDVERLEHVAQKAKNKAVRQKARKIVTEIVAAERAKQAPVVPDEVKRRRAEKAQLVREVEGLADTFDFAIAADKIRAAEAAWGALGGSDEIDPRFPRAVERFWKRKELHDSQARSAEELRAVAREAEAEKARAAAERAASASATVTEDEIVRAPEPDPAREAREAEARARREERERQRAEDEARRAAKAAERAAKQKEDAEKGAAIAASLEAMCAEMEQLLASDPKDTRTIDRLLSQASKAFEGIGKVPADRRDVLADRYRELRGKLVVKANERREAEDWLRWANVPKAEALIETAKEMAEAPPTSDLGHRLRQLQALWKEVGPMPQRRSKELWEAFKAACDQVYERVKEVRSVETEKFAEVAKVKEALIAEAESLADSTDFAGTADKLKALQARWKDSGHLPRRQGDELWKRFRAACDRFFERRKPMVEAQRAEQAANLARKQALIARAQEVADAAGEGTWGKAIAEIKELQRQWKEIGFVPRRDADAVYRAFRAACDALFAKRDEARDAEASAHRAEIDALRAEIEGVIAGGDDVVARAIAARARAQELGVLGPEVVAMVQHVIAAHPEAVGGTELDPAQLRARREKLIARVEELLPRQDEPVDAAADVATQLKQAMQKNAFGDLRFSGRDPVEVIDELRASWAEVGPILDDADRAQVERFEATIQQVLEAAGAVERAERPARRRRERAGAPPITSSEPGEAIAAIVATPAAMPEPSPVTVVPDASADAVSAITTADEPIVTPSVPVSAHDAITQPARLPPEVPVGMPEVEPVPVMPVAGAAAITGIVADEEPRRARSLSIPPPMDEVDTGWDLGDEDPTAGDAPSSGEMAGDGAVEGDGLDQVD